MKSDTGRYYVTDTKTGRKFCVEPIDNSNGKQRLWGDVDLATKQLTGSYGEKSRGAIKDEESIIREEEGFTNIGYAQNPMDYIDRLLEE